MADPITISAVAFLAPYLAKAGEQVAKKAGDATWSKVESLYRCILQKFKKDQDEYAQKTLQRLEEQPTSETRQVALADILSKKSQADPSFAQELQGLVQNTTQASGAHQFLTQLYDSAHADKIINIEQLGIGHF